MPLWKEDTKSIPARYHTPICLAVSYLMKKDNYSPGAQADIYSNALVLRKKHKLPFFSDVRMEVNCKTSRPVLFTRKAFKSSDRELMSETGVFLKIPQTII